MQNQMGGLAAMLQSAGGGNGLSPQPPANPWGSQRDNYPTGTDESAMADASAPAQMMMQAIQILTAVAEQRPDVAEKLRPCQQAMMDMALLLDSGSTGGANAVKSVNTPPPAASPNQAMMY